jgi:hypothetical protein
MRRQVPDAFYAADPKITGSRRTGLSACSEIDGFVLGGFVDMGFFRNCEIQILRKAIGLEIAFLQTRSALENPGFGNLGICGNAGQQPTQHIVLFDNMQIQRKFTRKG